MDNREDIKSKLSPEGFRHISKVCGVSVKSVYRFFNFSVEKDCKGYRDAAEEAIKLYPKKHKKRYAELIERLPKGAQIKTAAKLGVHRCTVNNILHGKQCDKYGILNELRQYCLI